MGPDAMLTRLQSIITDWANEPADVERLRTLTRPPMGNLPCTLYANFNLFWIGEEIQATVDLFGQHPSPLPGDTIGTVLARLLNRHAARLEKWAMKDTVSLLRGLADYYQNGWESAEDLYEVTRKALVAINRVQAWVDAMIPWADLDASVHWNEWRVG